MQGVIAVLVFLVTFATSSQRGIPRRHLPKPVFSQMDDAGTSSHAFNLAAFLDGKRRLVRLYSEIEPKFVSPSANGQDSSNSPHASHCHFVANNGTSWSTDIIQADLQWAYGDDERTRTLNKVSAFTIECQEPGDEAVQAAPQLSDGTILGKHIVIEEIELERKGRLAACSQPLFTEIAGLSDWVNYHSTLGVEIFHMHVPVGQHIDALFDQSSRDERIDQTTSLNERSPETIGLERLTTFEHPKVVWQEYHGAPTANYYSETPLFNACVYRFRYAYDFVLLYDCDEWFTLRWSNASQHHPSSIPEFLDRHLPAEVASLQLDSYAFPAQCAVSNHGDYHSRFTLRKKAIWKNMQKLIVRPLAVACTAIHAICDITEQFVLSHRDSSNHTKAQQSVRLPTDIAYIKHIRWFGPRNGSAISCKFGAEVSQWDPVNALVLQEDFPQNVSYEPALQVKS